MVGLYNIIMTHQCLECFDSIKTVKKLSRKVKLKHNAWLIMTAWWHLQVRNTVTVTAGTERQGSPCNHYTIPDLRNSMLSLVSNTVIFQHFGKWKGVYPVKVLPHQIPKL